MRPYRDRPRRVATALALMTVGILVWPRAMASAQTPSVDPKEVAAVVYRQLPDLPLENNYLQAKSQKPATDNTLVSRFIHYHTVIKGRSPLYRFDWKITLGDYLGINETVLPETYPSRNFLKSNPIKRDLQVIRKLTRQQRSQLVQVLSDLYGSQLPPRAEATPAPGPQTSGAPAPTSEPTSTPVPSVPARPQVTPLPVKGGAQLLRSPTPNQPSIFQPPQGEDKDQPTGEAQKLQF